jgi:glucoamylase
VRPFSTLSDGGLLPEQVWDGPDVPERELFFGRPSGSAMPLVWAHSEYIKLRRSLREGRVFDMPQVTVDRYRMRRQGSTLVSWRFNHKIRRMSPGKTLRMELLTAAMVQWSADGWKTVQRTPTRDTGLGIHVADLPTRQLPANTAIHFTFFWQEAGCWQGEDFTVTVS